MNEGLTPETIRHLLGGYATGTLTPAEQAALFAAALEDQVLFDALAQEQALRDHLADPAVRGELLAALAPRRTSFWQWLRRPMVAGLVTAGVAVIGVVGVWQATRAGRLQQATPVMIAELSPRETQSLPAERAIPQIPRDAVTANAVEPQRRKLEEAPLSAVPGLAPAVPPGAPAPQPIAEAMVKATPAVTPPPAAAPLPETGYAKKFTARDQAVMSERAAPIRAVPRANGFIAGEAGASAGSTAPVLWVTVLRESGEAPTTTPLNAGESVRLRVVSPPGGTLQLLESGKVLATATLQPELPFDTPALPFAGSGTRRLTLSITRTPSATPIAINVTLTYRP